MNIKPPLIIIINPVALHKKLCETLNQGGIKLMAFYTEAPSSKGYHQINTDCFLLMEVLTKHLDYDVTRIKELITNYDLISAIPGLEVDLQYAEQVAYSLCPEFANDPQDTDLRYKKYDMNEALKQAGLNYIPQLRISPQQEIPDLGLLRFPVIVKPSFQSGGSFGVKICQTPDETLAQIKMLQKSQDIYGKQFLADIVVQEKIEGVEYFADSVTWQGTHYITGIFKYEKKNIQGLLIYRYIQFVSPKDPVWHLCYEYIQKTLTVLKVRNGFAHTEFMMTDDNRPYLMEINPRLSGLGGQVNRLCKTMNDYDQSEIYLSLVKNDKTAATLPEKYQQQELQGRILMLFSWKTVEFTGFLPCVLDHLQSSSVVFHLFKKPGALVSSPKDVTDVVLTISLTDKDLNKIIADTQSLQQLEQNGQLF